MQNTQTDVLILGAGLAGLSAATVLQQQGKDYLVVEAKKHIGGRVQTKLVDTPDGPLTLELGAEWIGKNQKTILEICGNLGLELVPHSPQKNVRLGNNYYSEADPLYRDTWKRHLAAVMARINDTANTQELTALDNISFYDFLIQQNATQKEIKILELFQGTLFGCRLKDISAYMVISMHITLSRQASDGDDYRIAGGNGMLPHAMVRQLAPNKIWLQSQVQKITQTNSQVLVTLTNGHNIVANKIICTLPPTILKNLLWSPTPPPDLLQAWQSIHFTDITKTIFVFNKRFWGAEHAGVYSDSAACQVYHATANQLSSWGALNSYTFDNYATAFNALDDTQKVNTVLKTFGFNNNLNKHFVKQYKKDWSNDPFAKGAYAYYKPGQWFTVRPIMQTPYGLIHFAGEHLADDQGFMNGAIESGFETAKALITT